MLQRETAGNHMPRFRSRQPFFEDDFYPQPSVAEPRPVLLEAVLAFVRVASHVDGVIRITLIGSLATPKKIPKDADVVVMVGPTADLPSLAKAGRGLKGKAQRINLGADIFLAS